MARKSDKSRDQRLSATDASRSFSIPVVPVTLPIMRIFGEIDAHRSTAGQRLPISDLLIACSALARNDRVVTANIRHFDRIPGLKVERLL